MSPTDHRPSDPELDGLGDRLRRQAESQHAGDLGDLGHRAAARQRRSRIVVATACVALFVAVAGVGMLIGGRDAIDSTPAATMPPPPAAPATALPRWPTYSVVISDPEIWALEVVYDPNEWRDGQVVMRLRGLGLEMAGMSSYRREPKFYLYWPGRDGESSAREAQSLLERQPGIVSVQLGTAEPSRAAGTVPSAGSTPPGSVTPGG